MGILINRTPNTAYQRVNDRKFIIRLIVLYGCVYAVVLKYFNSLVCFMYYMFRTPKKSVYTPCATLVGLLTLYCTSAY